MTDAKLHPWVTRVGARLADNLSPIALYAFGSSVRDAPALGNDLDYLAVLDELPMRARYQEAIAAAQGRLCIKIDLVCRTPAMLAVDLEKPTSFVASIWSETLKLQEINCYMGENLIESS